MMDMKVHFHKRVCTIYAEFYVHSHNKPTTKNNRSVHNSMRVYSAAAGVFFFFFTLGAWRVLFSSRFFSFDIGIYNKTYTL